MAARKQRTKLATDTPIIPSGMAAFADLLDESGRPISRRLPDRPVFSRNWSPPTHCALYRIACWTSECQVEHPPLEELVRSSTDPSFFQRLFWHYSSVLPRNFADIIVLREDLPTSVRCRSLESSSAYSSDPDRCDAFVFALLKQEHLPRVVIKTLVGAPLTPESLLAVCEHPKVDDTLRAFTAASCDFSRLNESGRADLQYVINSACGLWGRAARALVVHAPELTPDAAVRRTRPIVRSRNAVRTVEVLETLAVEWSGDLDSLCSAAGLLSA